jgi:signal transduction histidine kinase
MSFRFLVVLFVVLLAIVSLAGAAIIVSNLNILGKNQDMWSFKDEVYHDHLKALTMILAAQSGLYQHQAGYSRDIDRTVNDIMRFEATLARIPAHYREHLEPACNRCHDDPAGHVDRLSDTIGNIQLKLDDYRRHISVLMTTNDANAKIVRHGKANVIGEEIIAAINDINHSAGLMVDDLFKSSQQLLPRTAYTIQAAMIIIVTISLAILAFVLWALNRLISSLLAGTESIYRDDFSLRLPTTKRSSEFILLASRFNLMAEHLQNRDREIREKTVQLEAANNQLRDLNENLEVKIHERTAELESMVEQLQKTSSALSESKKRLEAANVDLIQANQSKANFLSIVSHELKTPLSVINGFLSLILDERYRDDPQNMREAVEISRRRGQQLARMIDELIDLSRLDARSMVLHYEEISLDEAFRDVAEQFREEFTRKQIRIETTDCSSIAPVSCDPDKLKQVLTNLVGNAVKFSPEGSRIELGCREEEAEFLLYCRDEGIGLPPEEREKIFEKFYQVDSTATRRFGGAGLGLSIVKEIVQLHGGRIWVESEEGKGCTFSFTIPKKRAPLPEKNGLHAAREKIG